MTIAAILKHKGAEIVCVDPAMTVAAICQTLAEARIGAVPVMPKGERNQLLGMLSERDIIRALAAHGAAALQMRAEDLMTRSVRTGTPKTTVPEAMELMTEGRFRHLPIIQGGYLMGIVSIGDVVKARIDSAETEVDSLKAYVAGAA
jgi:CBS domain-containing protein